MEDRRIEYAAPVTGKDSEARAKWFAHIKELMKENQEKNRAKRSAKEQKKREEQIRLLKAKIEKLERM